MSELTNGTVLGRLLEEISWEGATVRRYRNGGRGFENVLTAEVLMPLSYLPRRHYLGRVIEGARGADGARAAAVATIEEARVTLLPDELRLGGVGQVVQPDGCVVSESSYLLLEAKRIRSSRFQAHQLAREYLCVLAEAGPRTPLLLLILGTPPPVLVSSLGRVGVDEAIAASLEHTLQTCAVDGDRDDLVARIPDVVAWTTWDDIRGVVVEQRKSLTDVADPSVRATLDRLTGAVLTAVDWHR